MIDRREILEAASSFSLLPNVVEKDYVLGWILAGIYTHEKLAESWIFKGGTCLKLARQLELSKLTFQVIRRTIATLPQKKGTVKDVQGLLRHSRAATTTDVYMQEIPESVRATVNAINRELRIRRENSSAS